MTTIYYRIRDRIITAGRRTCGYCGWGWHHRQHCPLTGRIKDGNDGWWM